jgi:hypothetical protein
MSQAIKRQNPGVKRARRRLAALPPGLILVFALSPFKMDATRDDPFDRLLLCF